MAASTLTPLPLQEPQHHKRNPLFQTILPSVYSPEECSDDSLGSRGCGNVAYSITVTCTLSEVMAGIKLQIEVIAYAIRAWELDQQSMCLSRRDYHCSPTRSFV